MTLNDHSFAEKLAWSRGQAQGDDMKTIKSLIPGCASVQKTDKRLDKRGIDYIATLHGGAALNIDTKRRISGVSKYWTKAPLFGQAVEPELTLEYWSVCPQNGHRGVVGWTLDESKLTDYILYLFEPEDTTEAFLVPFHLLRAAFIRNMTAWRDNFNVKRCSTNGGPVNGGYETESVYVPAWCVLDAIQNEMRVTA